ncbi:hypothetical protein [Cryobacterium melibiosiphilum]|nr:hypothetical protein [Cryobacterium melibiosiphilum]
MTADASIWYDRLKSSVEAGSLLDLAPGIDDDDVTALASDSWLEERKLPAEILRELLVTAGLVADPRGLQIRGALIIGALDLKYAKLVCRLIFDRCRFEQIPEFTHSVIPGLSLANCVVPGMQISDAQIKGDLEMSGVRSEGSVEADGIHIEGNFTLAKAVLADPDGDALSLDGAKIDGGAFMNELAAIGEVRALDVQVSGQLSLKKAVLSNPDGNALNLDGAKINGGASFSELTARGEVRALGIQIGGQLTLRKATLANPNGDALSLDAGHIAGGAFLNELTATGGVRVLGLHVGGQLSLIKANLFHTDGTALNMDGAKIDGDAYLNEITATGEVRGLGMHIDGQLALLKATLSNPAGKALSLDRATINGGAFLQELTSTGEVRALGIHIRGQLTLTKATLSNPDGNALSLDTATIDGGAYLDELTATGEVRAPSVHIGGLFTLEEATLSNPNGHALSLDRATIDGNAVLSALSATGQVRGIGLTVGGQLVLVKTTLSNAGGVALTLQEATVGAFLLDNRCVFVGRINLAHTTIKVLVVEDTKPDGGLPPLSSAQGWSIGAVSGFLRNDRKSAAEWLSTIEGPGLAGDKKEFVAQPWHELARTYDQTGQPEDGRWLRYQAAKTTTQAMPWASKIARWVYGALVGYGYKPGRVLIWIAVLWCTVFAVSTVNASAFTPSASGAQTIEARTMNGRSEALRVTGATTSPPNYPTFQPVLFAVDISLPAATTGQSAAWQVTGNAWIAILFAAIKGFSWILTALLLAGVTGLLRKS